MSSENKKGAPSSLENFDGFCLLFGIKKWYIVNCNFLILYKIIWGFIMNERIELRSDIHFGKPYISGTRIPIHNILELIKEGISFDKIMFP